MPWVEYPQDRVAHQYRALLRVYPPTHPVDQLTLEKGRFASEAGVVLPSSGRLNPVYIRSGDAFSLTWKETFLRV